MSWVRFGIAFILLVLLLDITSEKTVDAPLGDDASTMLMQSLKEPQIQKYEPPISFMPTSESALGRFQRTPVMVYVGGKNGAPRSFTSMVNNLRKRSKAAKSLMKAQDFFTGRWQQQQQ